ncbi:hypothetical protein IMG5_190530 [Ichthyophthirius multifiliis]|uniref:Uncharacterized protein n=1 Tax=Ichthyophthirius multifiliis TaxID=5932 RepID=G0R486_ICHMU|nr:hypothetical protein IMG5_190530 [Ichthyophthirius multifiliis]EGR27697.1 hypothetical protein IMG5_190530 [Ichthyophthirius multifiliis]|eukprot:XP_004025149.1 hypothetical protein IMG5_190530 [Ichthyophthirius multifiliis]
MKDQQEYLWIFDFKIKYLRQILTEVKANYKNVFETEIIIDNQSRRIIANEFCYFGEIIELKDKIQKNYCENSNKNNQLIAAQQYYNALKLYPFNGKFYFVLATLNKLNEDDFSAIYYCIRALYSVQGFQCKEKLQEFLEQTRLKCIQFEKENNNYGFIQVENYFKMFVLHFYSYTNIVLTKISIESIKSHCIMFKYLQNHIQYLLTQISQEKLEKECILLQFIVNIIIFTLNKFQEHIQEINDLSVKILEQNQIASECLKFTYGLLNHIFELYTVDPNKYSINLVLPILYYFIENQVIAEYLFSKYPGQMSLFNIILQKTQKKFDQIIQNFQTEEIDFEELASNYLNDLEMDIIGYKPLYSYFEKYKKKKLVLGDINLMFPVKLFIIKTQMEKIKSFVKQEEGQNIQNEEELEDDFQQLFFMNKNKIIPQKKLLIIIDGMNVAIRFGQSQFSSKGIQIAVDFWIKHNADVHVFLPDFCFSQDQIEKKRNKDKVNNIFHFLYFQILIKKNKNSKN